MSGHEFLGPFTLTYLALLVTPGPNFAVVAQASLSAPPRQVAATILGVATGAAMLAGMAGTAAAAAGRFGFAATLAHAVFIAVLLSAGLKALLRVAAGGSRAAGIAPPRVRATALWGFLTSACNPLSAAFFVGAAVALEGASSRHLGAVMSGAVFTMALTWFALVGVVLSTPRVRVVYARHWRPVDAALGIALVALALGAGYRLLWS